MEFGKVKESELEIIDFSLPDDHPENKSILKKASATKPKVYVGCAKWGRKDWIGILYPKGTKEKDFLKEYGKHFNSIELNSLFYQLQSEETVKTWKESVGKDFLFCPKFSSSITHLKRLNNTEEPLGRFLKTVDVLGEKLGPLLLMPHPQMGPPKFEVIKNFIEGFPEGYEMFVELRHPDWYTSPYNHQIEELLIQNRVGYVITDTAGRRDMLHMRYTTPSAFIRFVGNSLHSSDYKRIDEWVERIGEWLDQGMESVYFFMHQHEELHSPVLVKYLVDKLNDKCKLDLTVPALQES